MKRLFLLFAVVFAVSCNNAADTSANAKDSLDSVAKAKTDKIDSTAEQRKDAIDSTTERQKDALDRKDSANQRKDSASR